MNRSVSPYSLLFFAKKEKSDKKVSCSENFLFNKLIQSESQPIKFKTFFWVFTHLHSETTNIYSHLIPFIYVFISGFFVEYRLKIIYFSIALSYFFSVLFHAFRSFNQRLYDILLIFDTFGISIQIYAISFFEAIIFFQNDQEKLTFWVTSIVGLLIFTLISIPVLIFKEWYDFRIFLFTVMSFIPFLVFWEGYRTIEVFPNLLKVVSLNVICAFFFLISFVFKLLHIPELKFPNTIWQKYFHSSFFLHIFLVFAGIFECLSSKELLKIHPQL